MSPGPASTDDPVPVLKLDKLMPRFPKSIGRDHCAFVSMLNLQRAKAACGDLAVLQHDQSDGQDAIVVRLWPLDKIDDSSANKHSTFFSDEYLHSDVFFLHQPFVYLCTAHLRKAQSGRHPCHCESVRLFLHCPTRFSAPPHSPCKSLSAIKQCLKAACPHQHTRC
jgi:hypothetical protein